MGPEPVESALAETREEVGEAAAGRLLGIAAAGPAAAEAGAAAGPRPATAEGGRQRPRREHRAGRLAAAGE